MVDIKHHHLHDTMIPLPAMRLPDGVASLKAQLGSKGSSLRGQATKIIMAETQPTPATSPPGIAGLIRSCFFATKAIIYITLSILTLKSAYFENLYTPTIQVHSPLHCRVLGDP